MGAECRLVAYLQLTFRAFYQHASYLLNTFVKRDFLCGKVDLSSVIIYDGVGIVNSYTKLFKGMGIWLVMKN
jgi:hypothetical protein